MVIPRTSKKIAISYLEAVIADGPKVEIPVVHRFTPGLYIRECQIPAGALLTSMEHMTEHPFFILKGKIIVSSDNEGDVLYEAPFIGATLPNTKRALMALEDTTWVTVHRTDKMDPDEVGEDILAKFDNPLLNGVNPERLEGWRSTSPYQGPGKISQSCPGSQSEQSQSVP
jgi:hypothetical protein